MVSDTRNCRRITSTRRLTWLLAAYAASDVAARAAENVARLIPLEAPSRSHDRQFLPYFRAILSEGYELEYVREVVICRNIDLAIVRYTDAREVKFARPDQQGAIDQLGEACFRAEGVLSGGLLRAIFSALHDTEAGEFLG